MLSNFANSTIKYDNTLFPTAEHAFQWKKAVFFKDDYSASKIKRASTPQEAKKLGGKVQGFVEEEWNEHKAEFMREILEIKFAGAPSFLLSATAGCQLAEANPNDCVWGIGLTSVKARYLEVERWPGENLLGKILMDIRDREEGKLEKS